MFFHHPQDKISQSGFSFGKALNVTAHPCLQTPLFEELFNNFCSGQTAVSFQTASEFLFAAGEYAPPVLSGGDYALTITERGFCLLASTEKGLKLGFFALIERIQAKGKDEFLLPIGQAVGKPTVQNRMVHFCLFPETRSHFFKKFVRTAAALGFTHIVLEFWGSLRYDRLPELGWKDRSLEKSEIKKIIAEANELGMEVIPMLNHWGHATSSRCAQGKHVVLDQAPEYAYLFDETGWIWAYEKPEVVALLKDLRQELIELCGEGEYFHVGCDEAYGFDFSDEAVKGFTNYLNAVAADLKKAGRKAIAWGDMFLYRKTLPQDGNPYCAGCETERALQYFMENLSRDVVIADWQYDVKNYPVETALFFQKNGFETLLCPWDLSDANLICSAKTVKEHGLSGVMYTTWHTLSRGMPRLAQMATLLLGEEELTKFYTAYATSIAAFERKLCPATCYEDAGWSAVQTPDVAQ